ncbi:MAG TPA: hypothetical protein PK765_04655 [bacterium]|nr:hypothetical protein [bacterium]
MSDLEHILAEKDRRFLDRLARPLGENFVFRLGRSYYKFPNYPWFFFGNGVDPAAAMRRQVRLVSRRFGRYCRLARTVVVPYSEGYFLKQETVEAEKISLDMIERDAKVREAVSRLLSDNDQLWEQHGYYLDMIGSEGFSDPSRLHNLLWDGERIVLFDFGMLNARSANPLFAAVSVALHELQR